MSGRGAGWPDRRLPVRRGALSADGAADGREHLPLPDVPEGRRRPVHGLRRRSRSTDLVWTRGAPKIFASSAVAERGFCADCGTPLTYRVVGRDRITVTLGSLDRPADVAPRMQTASNSRLAWLDAVAALPRARHRRPFRTPASRVESRQHPDHDT